MIEKQTPAAKSAAKRKPKAQAKKEPAKQQARWKLLHQQAFEEAGMTWPPPASELRREAVSSERELEIVYFFEETYFKQVEEGASSTSTPPRT